MSHKSGSYFYVKQSRYLAKAKLVLGFGGVCCCCGIKDDPIIYDFHHRDPTIKDFSLTKRIRSWKNYVAEVEKCVLVCVICHRKIHAGMIQVPDTALVFDADRIPAFVVGRAGAAEHPCPVCQSPMQRGRTVCSLKCSGSLRKGAKNALQVVPYV